MSLDDIDLLDADRFQRQEHHEMFRRLRAEAPVYFHDDPYGGFWNLTLHHDVREANRDNELFSSQAGGISIYDGPEREMDGIVSDTDLRGVNMIYTDPPQHTRYRRLINKGFTPRMIGLLEQFLEHRSKVIVDHVIDRRECDFVEDLAAELPLQAIAEIMGVPQEDRHLIFQWTNDMIGADDPEYEGDPTAAAMAVYAYSHDLAEQRRADPRDDIMTKLLDAEIDGDRLTEWEIDVFMLLLCVAGSETTRNAISHGMHALLTHPEQFAALQADPEGLLPTAVDEMIRWATPVHHFRRTATADTEIGGHQITAGQRVVLWYASANRDEAMFDNPETFDITRDPNDHIAFGGGGAHYCLGANLARAELRFMFREILDRLGSMELAGEPARLRSNFINGIKHLPVSWS